MILKIHPKQLSPYAILYDKIPDKHILKLIDKVVDFSFINKLLEGFYGEAKPRISLVLPKKNCLMLVCWLSIGFNVYKKRL